MANWCNVRLIVLGERPCVMQFIRQAGRRTSSIFTPDMWVGEAADLSSEPMHCLRPGLFRKAYIFQIRNDDGCNHFTEISSYYPALCFLVVYGDQAVNEFGSSFIRKGRSLHYRVPEELFSSILSKHGYTDDDSDDWKYSEATWEAMDLAESYWQQAMEKQFSIRKKK